LATLFTSSSKLVDVFSLERSGDLVLVRDGAADRAAFEEMLLAVEDSGPGFGRLPRGSGLGLSAVARQAIEHQGRVECGRGRLGGGRVSLWLPTLASRVEEGMADAARAV